MRRIALVLCAVAVAIPASGVSVRPHPFYDDVRDGNLAKVKDWLRVNPGLANDMNYNGFHALHIAAERGRGEIVKLLLDAGARIDQASRDAGQTALHVATWGRHADTAKLLVKRGAKIDLPNTNGQRPLHLACKNGDLVLAELFVDKGADVTAADGTGATPLHWALWARGWNKGDDQGLVMLLLDKGADANALDKRGSKPEIYEALGARARKVTIEAIE